MSHMHFTPTMVVIGERERANLVVRTARIFYIIIYLSTTVRRPTAHAPGLHASIYLKGFLNFHMLPACYSVCSSVPLQSWISPEKMMPFVVKERGKENVVPEAVISMGNLASERTPVYSLGLAALLTEAVYTYFQSSWF